MRVGPDIPAKTALTWTPEGEEEGRMTRNSMEAHNGK